MREDGQQLLILYADERFSQPIEYTFRLLLSILGLEGDIRRIREDWDREVDPAQVVVGYAQHPMDVGDHHYVHIFASTLFGDDYLTPASLPAEPLPRLGDLPIIYQGRTRVPGHIALGERAVQTDVDIVAATYFMVTRYEEVVGPVQLDEHGRFPASASLAYREGFLQRPIVHEYAELLWSWILYFDPGFERRRLWGGKDFAVCVTHDVDSLRRYSYPPVITVAKALQAGDFRRATRIVGEYARVLAERQSDPYDTFDYLLDHELGHGLVPTFYFMSGCYGRKGYRRQDYRLSDASVKETLRHLESAGSEIGLHASYDAFDQPELLEQEKQALERAVGYPIVGLRQHFLRFEAPQSWRTWEQAGFEYDATLTFAKQEGFRAGICIPYRPFDILGNRELALWEVPLTVMEGTLFKYQGLDAADVGERFDQMVNTVAHVGGVFVLLWHNSFLDELVYPGVQRVYEKLIEGVAARCPLGMSIAETVRRIQ